MWKKSVAVISITIGLSACAASGVKVSPEQVASFERGKTTYADVVAALGQPNYTMMNLDGHRIATYSYAEVSTRPETFIPFVGAFVGGADMQTSTVTLRFDRNNLLADMMATQGAQGTGMGFASGTSGSRVPDQPRQ